MMPSKSCSNQALPPLSSLMRTYMQLRPEKTKMVGETEHEYKSYREGPPTIIEPSRIESSQSVYQQGHSVVATSKSLASNHLSHAEPSGYHNVPDIESLGFGASVMSPISPRTRCPSLTESILSSTTCASPGSHSPTTPISERGSISSTYGDSRGNAISVGSSYRDVQRNHHRHQHSHHHQHRVSKPYQSSGRPYSSLSPPPPMARLAIPGSMDHTKEKMTKHEKRRINHLNSEKKRRENIKDGMDALLKLVPQCTDPQMSKANILKKTKEFIMELHEVNKNLQIELKRARQENDELRRYVGHQQDPYKFACRL